MSRILIFGMLIFASCAGGNSNDDRPYDEQHRPDDYSNRIWMELSTDTVKDEVEYHKVLRYEAEKDFEGFLDQVWQMAFSGDARVYGVDFIGELDESNQLNPKELVDMLTTTDTMQLEDLNTGVQIDSIIKTSFNKSVVSAITIYFAPRRDGDEIVANAYCIGIGEQVFEEETGRFRGIANRFYVLNPDATFDPQLGSPQRLCLRSDSVGLIRPSYIEGYLNDESHSLEYMISETSPGDSILSLDFSIGLDFRIQAVKMAAHRRKEAV